MHEDYINMYDYFQEATQVTINIESINSKIGYMIGSMIVDTQLSMLNILMMYAFMMVTTVCPFYR